MSERLNRFRELMRENAEEAVLLHKPENMTYISGYTGEGCVLITPVSQYIITDSRYTEQAEKQASGWVVETVSRTRGEYAILTEKLKADNVQKLSIEEAVVTHAQYLKIREAAGEIPVSDRVTKVETLRMVKDAGEIENLCIAESITARAFCELLGHIKPGMTELEVKAELEYLMIRMGAEGTSFETIIASGPNSSMPHARAGRRVLQNGDFITMDFGASYNGYAADMTRTIALGSVTDEMRKVYTVVLEAQEMALEAMQAGVTGKAMDAIARDHITECGYGEYFGHSLGHATGLEIHEAPGCSWRGETVLTAGMSMTCEPGIYLPGRFGVRIEDLVIIEQGGIRNLATEAPKKLIIL